MRNKKAFLSLAVVLATGLLTALPAVAADPDPMAAQYKTCSAAGFTVTTAGPTACGTGGADTCIAYQVIAGGAPDHAATFVRSEATLKGWSGSANVTSCTTSTSSATGDSVIGLDTNVLCHERLIHWNNQQAKGQSFSLTVAGKRKPIITSVVMRKGNNQGTCQMVGIGFEDLSADGSCVHQCGDFDGHQSVRTIEVFKFKDCEVQFEFDAATGEVLSFTKTANSNPSCNIEQGPVGDLEILKGSNSLGLVTFGDGWASSGDTSCTTRFVAGRYYTVCD